MLASGAIFQRGAHHDLVPRHRRNYTPICASYTSATTWGGSLCFLLLTAERLPVDGLLWSCGLAQHPPQRPPSPVLAAHQEGTPGCASRDNSTVEAARALRKSACFCTPVRMTKQRDCVKSSFRTAQVWFSNPILSIHVRDLHSRRCAYSSHTSTVSAMKTPASIGIAAAAHLLREPRRGSTLSITR